MPLNACPDAVDEVLGVPLDTPADTKRPMFDFKLMCLKNRGDIKRSLCRDHVFAVRGSEIIDCFAPIYRYVHE